MSKESESPENTEGDSLFRHYSQSNLFNQILKATKNHYGKNKFENSLSLIQFVIAKIDLEMEKLINEIIHHPDFMQLESGWRGIWSLVSNLESDTNIKIKLLPASWEELSQDFAKCTEFDQSSLFQKIYSDEFGSPGGEPYGLLLADYEIGSLNQSKLNTQLRCLEQFAMVAGASFCPTVFSVNASLFGLESFELVGVGKNSTRLNNFNNTTWNRIRTHPDSRFIGFLGSKVLYRTPYQTSHKWNSNLVFIEKFGLNGEGFPFGSPVYPFGILAIKEFLDTGWFSGLRGSRENLNELGLISSVPFEKSGVDSSSFSIIPPIDYLITPQSEDLLDQNGIMIFVYSGTAQHLVLHNCVSVHQPELFENKLANENSSISSLFNYILCASRFAHFIKVIGRDKLGSFKTPEDCETYLTNWLQSYTDSGRANSRNKPLKSANVQIFDDPSKPGFFKSVIRLEPHLQVENVSATIKFVTNITSEK